MEEIKFLFADLSKRDIDIELRRILDAKVSEKYGDIPDEIIRARIDQEWHAIERSDMIADVAAMYEIVQWLRHNHYPYWMRGAAGSSLILYLLGITSGNPLPPHLYCSDSKSVEFLPDYRDGFDIRTEQTGNCSKHAGDGHNIPWQTLWGYGDYQATLDIDLPKELYECFKTLLKEHWLTALDSENIPNNPYEGKIDCIKLSQLSFMFVLDTNDISPAFYEKEFTSEDWMYITERWRELIQYEDEGESERERESERESERERERERELPTPTYFCDIVALSGLLHSAGAWDDDTEYMVFALGYSPSNMIAFRDDVYSYFLDHGFIEKDAWHGMNHVRKGLDLPVITNEMVNARDMWVLGRCHTIKYLFPKAHAVEHILFKLKAGCKLDQE